jgi:hypothetical protein
MRNAILTLLLTVWGAHPAVGGIEHGKTPTELMSAPRRGSGWMTDGLAHVVLPGPRRVLI